MHLYKQNLTNWNHPHDYYYSVLEAHKHSLCSPGVGLERYKTPRSNDAYTTKSPYNISMRVACSKAWMEMETGSVQQKQHHNRECEFLWDSSSSPPSTTTSIHTHNSQLSRCRGVRHLQKQDCKLNMKHRRWARCTWPSIHSSRAWPAVSFRV